MSEQVKFVLDESRLPEAWYNIAADLPAPPPPVLHPGTGQPVGPDDLAPLFPMQIILQEVSTDRAIAIPEEVRRSTGSGGRRRSIRARRLESALETPARIYYKYEGVSPDRLAQAEHGGRAGVLQQGRGREAAHDRDRRRAVGLGARVRGRDLRPRGRRLHGQVSYDQKPYRRALIETFGARVVASPSEETNAGRTILAEHPDSTAASGSRSPRRSRGRRRARTRSTRSARCSTTCSCTRR